MRDHCDDVAASEAPTIENTFAWVDGESVDAAATWTWANMFNADSLQSCAADFPCDGENIGVAGLLAVGSYDGSMDWVGVPARFDQQPYFSRLGLGGSSWLR
jgi:hypothetical protein